MRLYCDLAGNPFLSIEKNLLSIQMASNFYHREILYIGVAGTSFQIRWDVLRHSHISIQTKTAVLSFQSFFCLYLIQLYTHISLNYLCVWNVLYKFTCPALMYTICFIVEIAFPCVFFSWFLDFLVFQVRTQLIHTNQIVRRWLSVCFLYFYSNQRIQIYSK